MIFLKKNFLTICLIAAASALFMCDPATAASGGSQSSLMGTAKAKAFTTFNNVKSIIFIVGGFGLVLLAFGAIFGKINWAKFAALAVGLAILAAAGAIVRYATGDTNLSATSTGSGGFGDTFQESAADTY